MYQSLVRQAVLLLCLLGMEYGRAIAQPVIPDAPILQALVTGSATTIKPVMINGRPYVRPTNREQFIAYLKDSYGLPAFEAATFRSTYAQLRGKPEGWGQDWPGFGQRFGTAMAVSAINGNVRYGMEMLFHEDMRYIPCHGCTKKKKIENALLAEITARHDTDGFFAAVLQREVAKASG